MVLAQASCRILVHAHLVDPRQLADGNDAVPHFDFAQWEQVPAGIAPVASPTVACVEHPLAVVLHKPGCAFGVYVMAERADTAALQGRSQRLDAVALPRLGEFND